MSSWNRMLNPVFLNNVYSSTRYGGAGNDALFAGVAGRDQMTGAQGRDVFQFYNLTYNGWDRITDFDAADDVLWLRGPALSEVDLCIENGRTIISYDGGRIALDGIEITDAQDLNWDFSG